jgi:hypothetical protein
MKISNSGADYSNNDSLKRVQMDSNNYFFGYTVQSVSELPFPANDGDIMFVEENSSLYIFINGKWIERRPVEENTDIYARYQKRMDHKNLLRSIKAKKEFDNELNKRLVECGLVKPRPEMKIAPHYETYGKKKEPEQIGEREYIPKPARYVDVPLIFGIFGVETQIGTASIHTSLHDEHEPVYARKNEADENRIRVNISNFIYFLREIYIKEVEFEEPNKILFKNDNYQIKFPKSDSNLIVVRYKKKILWRTMLYVYWNISRMHDRSNIDVYNYLMDDKYIPQMGDLVKVLLADVAERQRIKNEKAMKEEEEKTAQKIYYEMLGI